MIPIQRILLPVDFSERCLRMTAYARALATTYGAELTLLHVVNPVYSFPATAISGPAVMPIPAAVIEDREEKLEGFAVEQLRDVKLQRLVYEGDPAEQIAGFVKSEDVQLVIMPTHGYGVLRRFLIGSVTAKVLHDVACPVLTGVHLDPHHDGSPRFSNVVCAVDVESHGRIALPWGAQFAADLGAQFGVVHVVAHADRMAQSREELNRLVDAASIKSANMVVRTGEPIHEVCSFAKEQQADLLVIGRGAREALTGTLTAKAYAIIRQSPCPVLSV